MRHYQIRTWTRGGRIVARDKVLVKETQVPRYIDGSKPSASVYRMVGDYLVRMGTSEVVRLMKTAPPDGIRWLTRAELASTRLATQDRGGESLVATPPPPSPPPPNTLAQVLPSAGRMASFLSAAPPKPRSIVEAAQRSRSVVAGDLRTRPMPEPQALRAIAETPSLAETEFRSVAIRLALAVGVLSFIIGAFLWKLVRPRQVEPPTRNTELQEQKSGGS